MSWRYGYRNHLIVALAGVKHSEWYRFHRGVGSLKQGARLEVRRQRDNPHDANAVAVLCDGLTVGMLPAKSGIVNWAAALAPVMDAGGECFATVQQHHGSALVIDLWAPPGTNFDELEVTHANPLPH